MTLLFDAVRRIGSKFAGKDADGDDDLYVRLLSPLSLPYSAQWTATSGAWENAANWSVTDPGEPANSVPGADDAVTIANNGSTGYVITYNSTGAIWSLTTGTAVTLDVHSGSLTITHGGTLSGRLAVDAQGVFAVAAGSRLFVAGNGVYMGALTGRGGIDFTGGVETFYSNKITVGTLELGVDSADNGSTMRLQADLSYSGDFQLDHGLAYSNSATLDLGGHSFSLRGTEKFAGTVNGPGTVNILGAALFGYHGGLYQPLFADSSVKFVEFAGATITQEADALISLTSEAGGTLYIDAGATYNVTAGPNSNFLLSGEGGLIDNSGTMTVSNDTQINVGGNFTNRATATLTVDANSFFVLEGGVETLNGALAGAGVLGFSGAQLFIYTSNITVAELFDFEYTGTHSTVTLETDVSYAGEFEFGGGGGELNLNGRTMTLSGLTNGIRAGVVQSGVMDVTGAIDLSDDQIGSASSAVALEDNRAITQSGAVALTGKLTIGGGDKYTITGAGNLGGPAAVVVNSGSFIDNSVTGVSHLIGNLANNGSLIAESGSLILNNEILGAGNEFIEKSAYLQINAPSLASQKVVFSSNASAELGLKDAADFDSSLYGFGATSSEAIDLIGFDSSSTTSFASVSGGLIVNISDGAKSASLHFAGSYNQSGFQLNAGSNGELLTYSAPG